MVMLMAVNNTEQLKLQSVHELRDRSPLLLLCIHVCPISMDRSGRTCMYGICSEKGIAGAPVRIHRLSRNREKPSWAGILGKA